MKRVKRWALACGIVAAVALLSGCVVVKPWQRARLAKRVMSGAGDPEEQACEHTFINAREGSGAAGVGVGAGCACN